MLNTIATLCTSILVDNGVIKEEKSAVMIYGFQLFISTASSLLSILLISLFSGNIEYGTLYLVVFMLLRVTANGFHARTYRGCFLLTNGLFLLYLNILSFYPYIVPILFDKILLCFCLVYVWINAPVEHPNHKLSLKNRRKNKIAARIIITIDVLLVILLYSKHQFKPAYAICVSVFIVVAMMMVKSEELKKQ